MTKLKPCPFCGGEAVIVRFRECKKYNPRCKECSCKLGYYNSKKIAVIEWNQRVHDVESEDQMMKLTKSKAVQEHRKMWNLIADETEKQERIVLEEKQ